MSLKAKHELYGEVDVVGFLGVDFNKAFSCVVVTEDGAFKAVPNYSLTTKYSEQKTRLDDLELKDRLDDLRETKDTRNIPIEISEDTKKPKKK